MAPYTREYSGLAKKGVRAETRDKQEKIRPTSVRQTHWLQQEIKFLPPSGAQGVAMSVRLSVTVAVIVCLEL